MLRDYVLYVGMYGATSLDWRLRVKVTYMGLASWLMVGNLCLNDKDFMLE